MPHLNGLEVVDEVREFYGAAGENHRPFFMMHTSNQEKLFREKCARHGVDFFAEKPIKEERLAEVLLQTGFIKKN